MHSVFLLPCYVDMQAETWNATLGEAGFSKLTRRSVEGNHSSGKPPTKMVGGASRACA